MCASLRRTPLWKRQRGRCRSPGVQPGRLQAWHRAFDQAQGREPGLRQHDLLLEPAALQLHVRLDRAAREIQHVGDLDAGQLQGSDTAVERGRPVQQQHAHDARAYAPLRTPWMAAVRIVHDHVPGAQVVHAAVAERLPHPHLGGGQILRRFPVPDPVPDAGALGHVFSFLLSYSRV
jgi:hypothetical protein